MMTKNMETKIDNAVKEAIEITKAKSAYVCALILQKHELLGKNNNCLYKGLLEAAFEVDGKQYFVDCVDAISNRKKMHTTYKYIIYNSSHIQFAKGQKTIVDFLDI